MSAISAADLGMAATEGITYSPCTSYLQAGSSTPQHRLTAKSITAASLDTDRVSPLIAASAWPSHHFTVANSVRYTQDLDRSLGSPRDRRVNINAHLELAC